MANKQKQPAEQTEGPTGRREVHRDDYWNDIVLEIHALTIQGTGADAFVAMEHGWDLVRASWRKSKPPWELVDPLAETFSNQAAEFIDTFPKEQHIAVAKHMLFGIFHRWMITDTDV